MSDEKIKVNTSVPVFLWKLWVLLSDSKNDSYIRWSTNGDSFLVVDVLNFSKKILPQYFKHNNFASFVRQLNLYGFRKVIDVHQGIINTNESDQYEFQHSLFKRGRQDLIEQIRRRLGGNNKRAKIEDFPNQTTNSQIQTVTESHREISAQLSLLRDQNERIWSELILLRDQHDRQSKVLDRLINFFASVFRPYNSGISNMLVNNFIQDGDNLSNYNNLLSTLSTIPTNNDTNSNSSTQNNTTLVPLESLPNLNFNHNALAALTFNMPSIEQQQQLSQNVDSNSRIDDSLYTLGSTDNSFQELPIGVSSIPGGVNTDVFGTIENSNDNTTTTAANKPDNSSNCITPLSHSISDNFLLQPNQDNVVSPFQHFNPLTSNSITHENSMYGFPPSIQYNINNKIPITSTTSNSNHNKNNNNKLGLDQDFSTIQQYLKQQKVEPLNADKDGGGNRKLK